MSIAKELNSMIESVPAFLVEVGAIKPCDCSAAYHDLGTFTCLDEIEKSDVNLDKWKEALANDTFRKTVDEYLNGVFPESTCDKCNPMD